MQQPYSSTDDHARTTAKVVPEMVHESRHILVLTLSVDTLKTTLLEELPRMRWGGAWTGPAGISFTLLLTMLTAEFKPALFLDATQWQTVFAMLFLGSVVLLVMAVRRSLNAPGVDYVVSRCRFGASHVTDGHQQAGLATGKVGSDLSDDLQTTEPAGHIVQHAPPTTQ
ncbi:MAG: hypothetical protein L0271_06450 [Gemmatimonadetes bacterium]|nr:hypothetical protein [Gemmatimonadota bacterium]